MCYLEKNHNSDLEFFIQYIFHLLHIIPKNILLVPKYLYIWILFHFLSLMHKQC